MNEKVVLIIRDGWGHRNEVSGNTIKKSKTPINDNLIKNYPNILLKASGLAVGLPKGYQGNSEVGHLTIGSGRIVDQSLVRINKSIKNGDFFKKKEFLESINNCKKNNSNLHIVGLLQKEGVHAHIDHLKALLKLCKKEKFFNIYLHIITDGRDAPPTQGRNYLKELIDNLEFGQIATISGRYYAMDRDKRWNRTKKAYRAIVEGVSQNKFLDPYLELIKCYKNKETDEFIIPRARFDYKGIKNNDSIIFYNSRTDRTRQLTQAIIEDDFIGWKRNRLNVFFVAMTEYYKPMNALVAFKDQENKNLLGEVLSNHNKKQLRISETEKYAHVTFFFNGQKEISFHEEKRIMIPSPKVKTYDKKPEMSIYKIKNKLIKEIKKDYDFILINLVNCDMVGHTGNKEATQKAVEVVDNVVGKIIEMGINNNYVILITADHGNAEDQTKKWQTSHTTNPVPFILVSNKTEIKLKKEGELQDIAPTILYLMGIKKPKEMMGKIIIKNSLP